MRNCDFGVRCIFDRMEQRSLLCVHSKSHTYGTLQGNDIESPFDKIIDGLYFLPNICFTLTRLMSHFVLSGFARHKLRQYTPRRLSNR
jgi:hypothetical protein